LSSAPLLAVVREWCVRHGCEGENAEWLRDFGLGFVHLNESEKMGDGGSFWSGQMGFLMGVVLVEDGSQFLGVFEMWFLRGRAWLKLFELGFLICKHGSCWFNIKNYF
jgi:hypothetical protein